MTVEFDARLIDVTTEYDGFTDKVKSEILMLQCDKAPEEALYGTKYHVLLTPKIERLRLCPFCGANATITTVGNDHGVSYCGICTECGAIGPRAANHTIAVLKWNSEG